MFFKKKLIVNNSDIIYKHLKPLQKYNLTIKKRLIDATQSEIENFKEETKEFFSMNFNNLEHNTKYIVREDFERMKELFENKDDLDDQTIREFLKGNYKPMNMYDIEVKLDEHHSASSINGYMTIDAAYYLGDITLSLRDLSGLKQGYIHELTHILVNNMKANIFDEPNEELLSVFLEYLSMEEDSEFFYKSEANRWSDITYGKFNKNTKEYNYYYTANIYSVYLYYLYRNMNLSQKRILLNNIEQVLNGKRSIRDFRQLYNLHFYNDDILNPILSSIDRSKQYIRKR
ncbi:MAG: hypothetical protein R3Y13_04405 [bacterium]